MTRKFISDGLREDRGNAEHWDEPSDLSHAASVGAYLTRVSWHVQRTAQGVKWAARSADGAVKTGTEDSVDQARTRAREHAQG